MTKSKASRSRDGCCSSAKLRKRLVEVEGLGGTHPLPNGLFGAFGL